MELRMYGRWNYIAEKQQISSLAVLDLCVESYFEICYFSDYMSLQHLKVSQLAKREKLNWCGEVCSSFINLHYFSMPFAFYSSNSLTSFYLYTLPVKFFNLLFFSFCISLYSFCRSNVNALQLYSFIYSIKALFFHGKLMADEFHVSKQYLSKLTTLFNHQ